ncbi:hypothetical protein T484DRAFT_1788535 [Baffinella frigidus]|nr:hypothetical protein T484DRAFT_1788535 [Cryptophyta sp. CCMP2293]
MAKVGARGDMAVTQAVLQRLTDQTPVVREEAIKALGKLAGRDDVEAGYLAHKKTPPPRTLQ